MTSSLTVVATRTYIGEQSRKYYLLSPFSAACTSVCGSRADHSVLETSQGIHPWGKLIFPPSVVMTA